MELQNMVQIDKRELMVRIADLINAHHDKMDKVTIPLSTEGKSKSEGYIEALYQIENVIINWGIHE